ncbi:hypothetical protein DES52_11782 [Deinococcus yavapaiensis KR-236]|uniref:Uncharacterized protein n=1 Tax=Deinococcus yavapaiensis KR-236 TaxID=694435 RepID=A0A318S257_9DEIO|nr:hypothetical protein DES52_11782 [Deinococcus yavapaiensis KR-236]
MFPRVAPEVGVVYLEDGDEAEGPRVLGLLGANEKVGLSADLDA